jgi:hypothetical protein
MVRNLFYPLQLGRAAGGQVKLAPGRAVAL